MRCARIWKYLMVNLDINVALMKYKNSSGQFDILYTNVGEL